jgi:hypothetical protein
MTLAPPDSLIGTSLENLVGMVLAQESVQYAVLEF